MAELSESLASDLSQQSPKELPNETATEAANSVALPAPPVRATRLWQLVFVSILVLFVGLLAFRLWDTDTTEQRASGPAPCLGSRPLALRAPGRLEGSGGLDPVERGAGAEPLQLGLAVAVLELERLLLRRASSRSIRP